MTQEAHQEDNGGGPLRLASFRTVFLLVLALILVWVALNVTHYFQSVRELRNLLRGQAETMAASIALADQHVTQTLEQVASEQAARLVAVGSWLRDLEKERPLSYDVLQRVADEAGVFNIVVFDSQGRREIGLRGQGPPPGAGGARARQDRPARRRQFVEDVEEFIESDKPYEIQGFHRGHGSGFLRFSAIVRRENGGAITVHINAEEQQRLYRDLGPETLMSRLVTRPGVAYLERLVDGETDLRFEGSSADQSKPTESASVQPDTFEVKTEVPDQAGTTLVVGFDAGPLRYAENELLHRVLWSVGITAMVGVLGLLWARLRRRHGSVARALQQIRSYHRALLERMDDAVVAWGATEGLTFWNQPAEDLFPGLARVNAGNPPPKSVIEVAQKTREGGGSIVMGIDGRDSVARRFRSTYEILDSPIRTNMLFLTDVTAVEEATSERHRREHSEALARVASGVAHEVRNPLNAIDMTIQTLCAEPTTLQEDDKRTLQDLRQEISRINGIVDHFLAYGRPQPPMFSETDPSVIMSEVASLLAPVANEKGITLELECEEGAVTAGDPQQLRQALLNIVLNALEASEKENTVFLWVRTQQDEILCGCRDKGEGMSQEELDHLFDPYFSTKPRGTGLGMSIVQRIVQSHKGKISVTSGKGEGTEIVLHFPRLASRKEAEK